VAANIAGTMDISVTVSGGGYTGQAGALVQGLGRALTMLDAGLRPGQKAGGFLTRDSRMKERKKYGQRGARRRFQFSKR
jgi:small subunit ribosomal protein S9